MTSHRLLVVLALALGLVLPTSPEAMALTRSAPTVEVGQ